MNHNAKMICLIVAFTCALLATSCWGQDAPQAAPANSEGLRGLLPEETPDDIVNTLNSLPETWSAWSATVTQELGQLYSKAAPELIGQRAALERLKIDLATVEGALADSRYGSIHTSLRSLRGALGRRIALLEAALDTLLVKPLSGPGSVVSHEKDQLLAATDDANAFLDAATGGEAWKIYLQTVEVRSLLTAETDDTQLLTALQAGHRKLHLATKSQTAAVSEFAKRPQLKQYLLQIDRVVAALNRARAGVNFTEVRNQLKVLLAGLERFEATGMTDAAVQVRTAYDALRDLAPDGGERLTAVLRQHYFNSNLHLTVSESFLNRNLAKSEVREGTVRDYVLGADVYGDQTTADQSTIDLLPDDKEALVRINLSGTVTTSTEGHASKAVIYSQGNNQFVASKDVLFNGDFFSTKPASINVSAFTEPYDASTRADNIPLFGGIARRIALTAANRNRPAAEAIAAERVASRIEPEFNDQVDHRFTLLNTKLVTNLMLPLKVQNVLPEYRAARSTDVEIDVNSRLMSGSELGGGAVSTEPIADGEMVLRVHETLVNNFLDRTNLGGKTMTEAEVRGLLQAKLRSLFGKKWIPAPSKHVAAEVQGSEPRALIFAEKDPLRIKIADGQVNLIIRAGFQRDADKGGNIPPQVVTVPLSVKVESTEVIITPGEISVHPIDESHRVAEQVVRAGVIKKRLERAIETETHGRTLNFNRDDDAPIEVNITAVEALDGWLAIHLR